MGFHRHPTSSRHDLAEDIRAYVQKHSDDKARLESLERLSALDLTVLSLAFGDMERRLERPRNPQDIPELMAAQREEAEKIAAKKFNQA